MTATGQRRKAPARRCPACGHPVESADAVRCGLCGLDFGDDRATGHDVTPFARAFENGVPGWWRMCEWVWFAGTERLKHMALMRSSAASRRFALLTSLWLAAGLSLLQAAHVGWREVTDSPAIESTRSVLPRGQGWLHVAATPRPLPSGRAPEVPVDLWWCPAQSVIAGATGFLAGVALTWLTVWLTCTGLGAAHTPPYRAERRMTAAVHYGMAWGVPALLAALIVALRPIGRIATISGWAWFPADRGVLLAAAVVLGLSAAMGWFWLVRAASTSPARTRGRVVAFVALVVPLLAAGAVAGWWRGLTLLFRITFEAMGLKF